MSSRYWEALCYADQTADQSARSCPGVFAGVAASSEEIVADPVNVFRYTARGNLVAVITDGTAVLGLGAIGPLAAKPVMEGKAVLFKEFAGIDVFDIEVDQRDPDKLIEVIAGLEPTFGGINLEDIKAPECFYVERELRKRMKIPVFHDDQHGTAIIVVAAVLNGLQVVGKRIDQVKLVVSGAGAAALACVDLLVDVGLPGPNVWLTDLAGVVWKGRSELMNPEKARFAQETDARTLAEVIGGADLFLGLSAGGVLKPEMVAHMAPRPLIFALANPDARDSSGRGQGRSQRCSDRDRPHRLSKPGQQRSVLPLHFPRRTRCRRDHDHAHDGDRRCARDRRTCAPGSQRNCCQRLWHTGPLLRSRISDSQAFRPAPDREDRSARGEGGDGLRRRDAGQFDDFDAYRQRLQQFVYHSGTLMKPIFAAARPVASGRSRIILCEGEEERVLRAVQIVVDEKLARPILIGRPAVIEQIIRNQGLRLQADKHYTVVNPEHDDRYHEYWTAYQQMTARRGVTPQYARLEMRRRRTLIGAMLLHKGEGDGLICGTSNTTARHLHYIDRVIGKRPGASVYAAMNALVLPNRQVFLVDTHVNLDPTAEQIAEITTMAADVVRRFGVELKVALLSHSNFGSSEAPSALKMRHALALLRERAPELEVDGEMHGDSALDEDLRKTILPDSTLHGSANLLVCPNLDAANIAYNLLKTAAAETSRSGRCCSAAPCLRTSLQFGDGSAHR